MKEALSSRERFNAAADHRQADRAVFDLCGCPQTLIDYEDTRKALGACLGFTGPPRGGFPLDERILEYFDIDTRMVGGMPTPKTVHNRAEGEVRYDSYGIGSRLINGHYEICHNPLKGCTIDEMLAYPLPEASELDRDIISGWGERARRLRKTTDYAIVAAHPVLGIFEIGCWLFGFDDYLYRLAAEPELVHAFSRRILEYQKGVIEIYYNELGPWIDCTTSGDDFGMQTGAFMSADMFNEFIAPYFAERIAYTKKFTPAFYQHHSCGSIYSLIPSLVTCGVDIINPIQPGAYMMEPERLKKDYGSLLAFWGGIDTQALLPLGSAEEVKAEVKRILSIMGNEGYILSPAHCIQQDVPAENIAAIYAGARDYYETDPSGGRQCLV
jgi:uroporphyrinogen decarboxylase